MQNARKSSAQSKHESLADRRRSEILKEASLFFAEFGYRNADLQVLANRLNIGKGTVYRYFPSKEALFFASVDAGIQGLIEVVERASPNPDDTDPDIFVEGFRQATYAYLKYFEDHPHVVELLMIERAEFRDRESPTYFIYKKRQEQTRLELIKKSMDLGILRPMEPRIFLEVFSDALYGTIFANYFSKRKTTALEQSKALSGVMMVGVLTESCRASLKQKERQ